MMAVEICVNDGSVLPSGNFKTASKARRFETCCANLLVRCIVAECASFAKSSRNLLIEIDATSPTIKRSMQTHWRNGVLSRYLFKLVNQLAAHDAHRLTRNVAAAAPV